MKTPTGKARHDHLKTRIVKSKKDYNRNAINKRLQQEINSQEH